MSVSNARQMDLAAERLQEVKVQAQKDAFELQELRDRFQSTDLELQNMTQRYTQMCTNLNGRIKELQAKVDEADVERKNKMRGLTTRVKINIDKLFDVGQLKQDAWKVYSQNQYQIFTDRIKKLEAQIQK